MADASPKPVELNVEKERRPRKVGTLSVRSGSYAPITFVRQVQPDLND